MLLFSFYIISSNSNAEDACSNDISQFEQESAEGPLECRECVENSQYEGYLYVVGREQPAQSGFLFYCFTGDEWKVVTRTDLTCLATEVEGGLATEVGGGGGLVSEVPFFDGGGFLSGGDLQVLNEKDFVDLGDEKEAEETGAGSSFKVGTGSW